MLHDEVRLSPAAAALAATHINVAAIEISVFMITSEAGKKLWRRAEQLRRRRRDCDYPPEDVNLVQSSVHSVVRSFKRDALLPSEMQHLV
jgi:hypothetical protein